MNEDYLWDKTGGDVGIEKLENTLHVFSYKPMPPPQLPAKVMTLAEKQRGSFFKLVFAMAFASAIVVVLSAAWFLIPNRNMAVDTDSVKVIIPQNDAIVRPVDTPPTLVHTSPAQNEPVAAKIKTRVRPATHLLQTTALKVKDKQPPIKLTDEEKYAYGQLMLALSITGSKLKIVRDTIAGTENTKPFIEKGRDLYQK